MRVLPGRAAARTAALLLALLGAPWAEAQSSSHQRVGVEAESTHCIDAGLEGEWSVDGTDWASAIEASLEYEWRKTAGIGACLQILTESAAVRGAWLGSWRLGDPRVEASCLWRAEGLRTQASLHYYFPLDQNGNKSYHSLEAGWSCGVVRDPLILAVSINARLYLPREDGGYLLWPPFSGSLEFSSWELVNDKVSCRFSISPSLSLGTLRLGVDKAAEPHWALALAFCVAWNEKLWGLRAGWSGPAYSSGSAAMGTMDFQGDIRKEW